MFEFQMPDFSGEIFEFSRFYMIGGKASKPRDRSCPGQTVISPLRGRSPVPRWPTGISVNRPQGLPPPPAFSSWPKLYITSLG